MFADRDALAGTPARETALACLEAGIAAALPARVVADAVSVDDETLRIRETTYDLARYDRVVVCGGGKAAGGVARALESALGDRIDGGVVVSTDGTEADRVAVRAGDHPTPSERNVAATADVLAVAREVDERTLVLAVVTGGASALLCAPADGLTLADLRRTTDALLASGASIDEVNAVRTRCSAVKGGRLARAAAPATVATLAISDVVGDDPAVIGSGPTVPDPSTDTGADTGADAGTDAREVLARYDLAESIPASVRERLDRDEAGAGEETPTADGPVDADWHLLANGRTAVDAAREIARERGYRTLVLSSHLRGEAREVGRVHAAVAEEIRASGDPVDPPAVVCSGGEVTVTVRGDGAGGPNQELALAGGLAFAERGTDAVLASVDTDGIDGATDACGALVDAETVDDPAAARRALDENDAGSALAAADALLETGYTGTNVNDLRVLVVE